MKNFVFGWFLVAATSPLAAQPWRTDSESDRWQYVTTSTDDSVYFVDTETLRSSSSSFDSYKTAWIKINHSNNKKKFVKNARTKLLTKIVEEKQLYYVKCESRQIALMSYAEYSRSGSVLSSGSDYSPTYRAVIPETIGEEILKSACDRPEPM